MIIIIININIQNILNLICVVSQRNQFFPLLFIRRQVNPSKMTNFQRPCVQ